MRKLRVSQCKGLVWRLVSGVWLGYACLSVCYTEESFVGDQLITRGTAALGRERGCVVRGNLFGWDCQRLISVERGFGWYWVRLRESAKLVVCGNYRVSVTKGSPGDWLVAFCDRRENRGSGRRASFLWPQSHRAPGRRVFRRSCFQAHVPCRDLMTVGYRFPPGPSGRVLLESGSGRSLGWAWCR